MLFKKFRLGWVRVKEGPLGLEILPRGINLELWVESKAVFFLFVLFFTLAFLKLG